MQDVQAAHPAPERARLVPLPRPQGTRWLTFLDRSTAEEYGERVARVAPHIESRLPAGVIANRVRAPGGRPPGNTVQLEPWRSARRRFLREARRRAESRPVLLLADVRDCYPSIRPSVVGDRLVRLGCDPGPVAWLVGFLDGFIDAGIRGLPIGPPPSAVLANAVLEAADRAVAAAGGDHLRWVDDFAVFARDADHAARILDRLRSELATLGLALAEQKTRVISSPQLARTAALRIALSESGPRI